MDHEISFIKAFVIKERQDRYLNLVSTEKGRKKFRSYLSHFKDLDLANCELRVLNQDANQIYQILKSQGSRDECYVIAENSVYDQRVVSLFDAVSGLVHSGVAFILSCIPGRVAYYEGEEMNERFVLVK